MRVLARPPVCTDAGRPAQRAYDCAAWAGMSTNVACVMRLRPMRGVLMPVWMRPCACSNAATSVRGSLVYLYRDLLASAQGLALQGWQLNKNVLYILIACNTTADTERT